MEKGDRFIFGIAKKESNRASGESVASTPLRRGLQTGGEGLVVEIGGAVGKWNDWVTEVQTGK